MCLFQKDTIRLDISHINNNGYGIALVIDSYSHSIGNITDDNVRQARLTAIDLD